MWPDLDSSVPDWVLEIPESVKLFEQLGIDYHCAGRSLRYECQHQGLNPEGVLKQLEALRQQMK